MVGVVLSTTDTVKAQVAVLFEPSVAVKVTVWLPVNRPPEAGVWLTPMLPGAEQLSDFVAKAT